MMPTMVSCIENMLRRWGKVDGKEIEVLEEFRVLTSNVISKTAFGSNYIEGQDIFDMLTKLMSIVAANANKIKLPIIGKFVKSSDEREAEKLTRKIRASFIEIIKRRQEQIPNGELTGYGSDFLGLLVDANRDNDEEERISIDDIIDECKTFYTAGHEMTMLLLTWTMLLLAIHSDWQEKARKEVFDIFGENPPNVEDNSMSKLKTMTMIINESLRLYPPVLVLRRMTDHQVR
ncbi:Cytochrome p450 [Thalictrum thalictroides]|uniref:Cytochrome p450 n=1 Tax=Thalictrum thalictroides TaxID=46969 RepID=A0A7J6WT08_THATH|nr:Cytochrome p450 [Thalictrum thalictroides]